MVHKLALVDDLHAANLANISLTNVKQFEVPVPLRFGRVSLVTTVVGAGKGSTLCVGGDVIAESAFEPKREATLVATERLFTGVNPSAIRGYVTSAIRVTGIQGGLFTGVNPSATRVRLQDAYE